MLDILLVVLGVVAVGVGGFLLYASRQPDTFNFERSIDIAVPPSAVFPLINDLREMNRWNPFVLNAPDQAGTYGGPAAGTGASYDFEGRKSGSGRIEIAGAQAPDHVEMRLVMRKPMACDNRVDFTLTPIGSGTHVTWAMSGNNSLLGKAFGLIMCSDDMVGKSFTEGLGNLKAIAEAPHARTPDTSTA